LILENIMKPRLILMADLLLAVAAATSWLVVPGWQSAIHPRVLPQFARADRAVLGWGTAPVITVTGSQAREIVRLVTTAKPVNQPIGILMANEVRFYQGTNYLGRIGTSHGLFSTGGFDPYGYEAEKEKMESLVDNPVRKAEEAEQRDKTPAAPPKPSSGLVPAGRVPSPGAASDPARA
jgi:hypothetical protein